MQNHFRRTFLAGAFAAIPIVVTVALVIYLEKMIAGPIQDAGFYFRGLGLILALVGVYCVGLFVTSFLGRWVVKQFDHFLQKIPIFRELYKAWKQVSFTAGGGEGIYTQAVLIPDESGKLRLLAFTSGDPVSPGVDLYCAFVPNAPNPVSGRVVFVTSAEMIRLTLSTEEVFKVLLSSGNYVPSEVARGLGVVRPTSP
jgi:uncharacterized membrane protein